MPPARTARRAVTNENDENVVPRVTRAKAAAGAGFTDDVPAGVVKKALQVKKTNTLTGAAAQRKRAALGDVSNVAKNTEQDDGVKDTKKPARTALTNKNTSAGIQKPGRTTSTRQPLGLKEKVPKGAELKRPGSGSGVMGGVVKKRSTSSGTTQAVKEEEQEDIENQPPRRKVEVEQVEVNIKETKAVKVETKAEPEVEEKPAWDDLDQEDIDDPLMVAEYAAEIFDYWLELEAKTQPSANYMDHQDNLSWKKRDMLNDWLIEVHQKFQLLPETFFVCINMIDRFLTAKVVQLDKLQLVGITCMFIASKYEEVMSPHVSNFAYLASEYTEDEILAAERFVLATIDYDLSYPNPMNFLRRISKADSYDMQTRTLGKYLVEISALDHRFLKWPQSLSAAAAMYMARMMLARGEWDATLEHYSGYTEAEIEPVFAELVAYCMSPKPRHDAFHNKYASRKYMKASLFCRQWCKKNFASAPTGNVFGAADAKPARRSE